MDQDAAKIDLAQRIPMYRSDWWQNAQVGFAPSPEIQKGHYERVVSANRAATMQSDNEERRKIMATVQLELRSISVFYANGTVGVAQSEGNNASWPCLCGYSLWLLGRCYFQFGHTPQTVCPNCGATYEVRPDQEKKAESVAQV